MDQVQGTAKEPVGNKGASQVKAGDPEPMSSERSSGEGSMGQGKTTPDSGQGHEYGGGCFARQVLYP